MKRKHSVGYFSSYDRGLECLLDMWPKVLEQVPDATLDIYYGWDTFDQAHKKNPVQMKWKWQMIKKMYDVGAKEHGRVNHEELAKAMKEIQVWAYPTEFTEIHCITALKAQEAGCYPVITEVGALKETVKDGFLVDTAHIYTDEEKQEEFIRCIVRVLIDDGKFDFKSSVPNRYWLDVAKVWNKELA